MTKMNEKGSTFQKVKEKVGIYNCVCLKACLNGLALSDIDVWIIDRFPNKF